MKKYIKGLVLVSFVVLGIGFVFNGNYVRAAQETRPLALNFFSSSLDFITRLFGNKSGSNNSTTSTSTQNLNNQVPSPTVNNTQNSPGFFGRTVNYFSNLFGFGGSNQANNQNTNTNTEDNQAGTNNTYNTTQGYGDPYRSSDYLRYELSVQQNAIANTQDPANSTYSYVPGGIVNELGINIPDGFVLKHASLYDLYSYGESNVSIHRVDPSDLSSNSVASALENYKNSLMYRAMLEDEYGASEVTTEEIDPELDTATIIHTYPEPNRNGELMQTRVDIVKVGDKYYEITTTAPADSYSDYEGRFDSFRGSVNESLGTGYTQNPGNKDNSQCDPYGVSDFGNFTCGVGQ